MPKLERKPKPKPDDKLSSLPTLTQLSAVSPLPNGSLHGLIKDLTITGAGYSA